MNKGAGLDQRPGVGKSNSLDLAEGPGVGTGDGPELDKGLADGVGMHDGSSDGIFTMYVCQMYAYESCNCGEDDNRDDRFNRD